MVQYTIDSSLPGLRSYPTRQSNKLLKFCKISFRGKTSFPSGWPFPFLPAWDSWVNSHLPGAYCFNSPMIWLRPKCLCGIPSFLPGLLQAVLCRWVWIRGVSSDLHAKGDISYVSFFKKLLLMAYQLVIPLGPFSTSLELEKWKSFNLQKELVLWPYWHRVLNLWEGTSGFTRSTTRLPVCVALAREVLEFCCATKFLMGRGHLPGVLVNDF